MREEMATLQVRSLRGPTNTINIRDIFATYPTPRASHQDNQRSTESKKTDAQFARSVASSDSPHCTTVLWRALAELSQGRFTPGCYRLWLIEYLQHT